MANTTGKLASDLSSDNVMREIYNPADASITTSPFVTAKVGHKVTRIDTAGGNLAGATAGDDFSYLDGSTLLYTIRVLYSDSGKNTLISVERVA